MRERLRLQAFLARAGVASRRKAEDLIRKGRVRVNGALAVLGQRVGLEDVVEVDGRRVVLPEPVVLALYKPRGYTTTRRDPHAERTVFALLPPIPGLHPVGRLDRDSEGLLLFTNDGDLTLRLTHPRYGVRKVYRVWTKEGTLAEAVCRRLERGVVLEDGPARALSCKPAPGGALLTLREGRKREVRRMLQAVGFSVVRLLRLRVGPIGLRGLRPGQYRRLSPEEVRALWAAAGLPRETGLEEGGLEVHGPHPVQEEGVSGEGLLGDGLIP
ncbi:pseudouridine synthase [Thermus igniterrae]|uniref:pseudouridine synthase n=1 Tax=Thermus igniterrae TaxID=88189 RepID=UPI00035F1D11|nr:pseudouridine synthase [Thermus igniterrae]